MNLHVSIKLGINEVGGSKIRKAKEYFESYRSSGNSDVSISGGAQTSREFNRDLVLWLCRDLLPFEMIVKLGMIAFFQKNLFAYALP